MELEFYGAAGQVTGSCHILRCGDCQVLLDCGLIQGSDKAEAENADPFPFDPHEIDAVVLSHAHIDHSGRLPLLVKRGFRGTIHTQNATRSLQKILLADAAGLEASRVRRENRKRQDKGKALLEALYDPADVDRTLAQTKGHGYGVEFDVVPGVRVRFDDAGHIMGSGVVVVELELNDAKRTLVFSGDLGQYGSPILRDPVSPTRADRVVMESTYGDRNHRDRAKSLVELGEVLEQAWKQKGNVLIPAFAVGRSQEILYALGQHFEEWHVDRWHIFLDSPLGIEASEIYWEHEHLFDEEAAEMFRRGDGMPELPNLHLTRSTEESRVINRMTNGAIVIAGSGMCNGGRILHHFLNNIERRETHILFTGYQPYGTLGRRIIDGAETIRIHGQTRRVRGQVHTIGGMSAHGDQADLLHWYRGISGSPPVSLVHGDPDASEALRRRLVESGVEATVAEAGTRIDLLV